MFAVHWPDLLMPGTSTETSHDTVPLLSPLSSGLREYNS